MAPKEVSFAGEAVAVEPAPSIASSTPSQTWKGWLWDSADVSKEERKFLLKVGPQRNRLILYNIFLIRYILPAGLYSFDVRDAGNVDQMDRHF